MDNIEINVSGYGDIASKIARLSNFYRSPALRAVLEDAGQAYVNLAKTDAPISRNPGVSYNQFGTIGASMVAGGGLRNSIEHAINNFGSTEVTLRIKAGGPSAPYAPHVEFGTTESMRIAVRKQVMFWMEDGEGRKVQFPWNLMAGQAALRSQGYMAKFRQIVWHPGTRAQPFFFKQLPIVFPRLINALVRAINAEWSARNT